MQVICPTCQKDYTIEQHTKTKPAPWVEPTAEEVFSQCPECATELVLYYDNDDLKRRRKLLDVARANYQRAAGRGAVADGRWRRYKQLEREYNIAYDLLKRKAFPPEPAKH